MRVLVVGGAGYIGSVTVDQLIEAGHQVVVLDSLVSGHAASINEKAKLIRADCRDEDELTKAFSAHNFDAVLHYGGYIQASESMRHPDRYFANNIGGVITVLNAMLTHGVSRFVFSSSAAVYGDPEGNPITEDFPIVPINPYGESKAVIEKLLSWYDKQCGLRYIALRYFNAAGATVDRGEDHKPETHLIPIALEVALGRRKQLSLFGAGYPTPDGACIRDYIHVSDLAQAHILALKRLLEPQPESGVYNLGNGQGFSNLEVIASVRRVTGHALPVSEEPRRPGDPAVLVASAAQAQAQLHWRPQITALDEIVGSAWAWRQAHPDGYGD